ncbi:regulator of microtubule dynamics protein 1-like [Porites lutea]|uniref:regulator of microtubule dynamics protein 1-like n=1 Tax=Porites lutea TaxID=51062 RepID=UPI003CC5C283
MSELENDLKVADELHENGEARKVYDMLIKYKDLQNAEVEWRLARACRILAMTDSEKKKAFTYEAHEHAKLALSLDDKNATCHKWFGISISLVGDVEGVKYKLANAITIKEHFEKAAELDPKDPSCRHLLGIWCFNFADMDWFTRNLAKSIFGSPPTCTYQEALECFQRAEELEPNFYNKNHLMLGKVFLRMKKKDEAKKWLEKADSSNGETEDDKLVRKEAKELLRKHF